MSALKPGPSRLTKFLTVPLLVGGMLVLALTFASGGIARADAASRLDYIDEHLKECMQIKGLDMDTCEEQLGQAFDRRQMQTSKSYLEGLMKDRSGIRLPSPVPESQISRIWNFVHSLSLDFHDEADGCWARADIIAKQLGSQFGVQTFLLKAAGHIRVTPQHLPLSGLQISWRYHIAPLIMIKKDNGQNELRVIDPTLFPNTLPTALTWLQRLEKESSGRLEFSLEQVQQSLPNPEPVFRKYRLPDRRSPLAREMVGTLHRWLQNNPVDLPVEIQSWPPLQIQKMIEKAVSSEARCSGTGQEQICGVYFLLPEHRLYCRWHLPLAQPAQAELECFPYVR